MTRKIDVSRYNVECNKDTNQLIVYGMTPDDQVYVIENTPLKVIYKQYQWNAMLHSNNKERMIFDLIIKV